MNTVKKRFYALICMVLVSAILTGCSSPIQLAAEAYSVYMKKQRYEQYLANRPKEEEEPEQEVSVQEPDIETNQVASGEIGTQTIMVYMVGSNLESEYGNATLDLEEMMDADVDTQYNNIVVYTGGASRWQMDGVSPYKNSTLLLNSDHEFDIVNTTSAQNMGNADTLSSFINYCYENFESDTYSLVLWDHGAGPVYGFGLDENYQDILTVEEMKEAFEDSVGKKGQKLEWIGFDACLMNSLEIADLLAPYANYMIASQETEPGWGWNYEFLSETSDRLMSGDQMGEAIIDYYMSYGEQIFEYYPKYYCDLTLSCIDLNKFQTAENALNTCFGELNEQLTVATYPELVRNRESTRDFGTYATNFDYGMVDIIHLLKQIAPESQTATEAIEAIEDMVVYSKSNMRNANGISICYPYSSDDEYAQQCIIAQEKIDFSKSYRSFLEKFYAIQNGEPITNNWDFSKATTGVTTMQADANYNVETSDISLQLTQEQQENFASADFYILCNAEKAGYISLEDDPRAEEMYMFVHLGKDVTLDENGALHGYYGNQVLYIYDATEDDYSPIPMILVQEEKADEETRYTCNVVLNNWNIAEVEDWETQGAYLQIVVDEEHPNGLIRSAVPFSDEEETSPSKQLLDLEDFGILETVSRGSYITKGANGENINFYDWETSGWLFGISQDLTHDYSLEMRPLENPENYVCVFRIKDVQGNVSYSEMIPLQ